MNIEERLREIIREELKPVLELLRQGGATPPERPAVAAVPTGWLTTPEAAAWLSVKPKTMHNWRSAGIGPAYRKIGRAIRYDAADIERYIRGEQ